MNISKELKDNFFIYADAVNNERAFPDVRDGLKTVQRACLWEMSNKGYSSKKPHVKCAKVSGGVIANYHPHGDQSAYDAMVRMSQPWINNIPEIDWHGGNGSQLGGPEAAASRYTECRLSEAVEDGYFGNIKKNTVDFISNFSEDDEWPSVFPSVFPRLFVNGSQGIGYTIAQEWEPGNLNEFTEQVLNFLKTHSVNCNKIFPDYPSGGVIVNKKDIHKIYETGKGTVILRAKTEIDRNIIKITEMPYQVYAEPVISAIKDLVNASTVTGIEDICNKSDDNGLLIEIECSEDPQIILNKLFKLTDLQVSFSANQMALVNGVPKMLTLAEYIEQYVNFNKECLTREYKYDLDKSLAREEILQGLVKAISISSKVIATIRMSKTSSEAVKNLVEINHFTENQAKAIVDMKLGRLANLEVVNLENELKEVQAVITNCKAILDSDKNLQKEFVRRLKEFTNKYGWERRSEVIDVDLAVERKTTQRIKKSAETYVITLSDDNTIRRIKLVNYKGKEDLNTIRATVKDKVILISEKGILYRMPVKKIALSTSKSTGTSLNEFYPDKIIKLINEGEEFFFISKYGRVKRVSGEVIFKISKLTGTTIMKLDEGDSLINVYSVVCNDSFRISTDRREYQIKVKDFDFRGKSAGDVACASAFKGSKGKNNNIKKVVKI